MLYRKANRLIIKYDCCLPLLKTEGNEWNLKCSQNGHVGITVSMPQEGAAAITAPLLPTEKKEPPTTDSCLHGFANCRGKHELKINWEPRWSKVSRMWNMVKLHYNILYDPRHFGTFFFCTPSFIWAENHLLEHTGGPLCCQSFFVVMVFGPEEIQGKRGSCMLS